VLQPEREKQNKGKSGQQKIASILFRQTLRYLFNLFRPIRWHNQLPISEIPLLISF